MALDDARADLSGFSFAGAAAIEAGGEVGFAGTAVVIDAVDAVGVATDGTAAARTLVTIARAATGVFSASLG